MEASKQEAEDARHEKQGTLYIPLIYTSNLYPQSDLKSVELTIMTNPQYLGNKWKIEFLLNLLICFFLHFLLCLSVSKELLEEPEKDAKDKHKKLWDGKFHTDQNKRYMYCRIINPYNAELFVV